MCNRIGGSTGLTMLILVLAASCSRSPDVPEAQQSDPGEMQPAAVRGKGEMHKIEPGNLMAERVTFEFAVYYLPEPSKPPLEELGGLLRKQFKQFQRVEKISKQSEGMVVAARMNADVKRTYVPPDLVALKRFGHGLSQEQAAALQSSRAALILDFAYPRERVWDGMRAALELTCILARTTSGIPWDDETREVFTPDAWEQKRLQNWKEAVPDISCHTVIHAYKKDEYIRAITLGMSKFGLPDIAIDGFSWSLERNMGHIINLFGQAIAEGARLEKPGEFDLDLRTIKNPDVRDAQVRSLKSNATSIALLSLKEGVWEEGDPRNRLIEVAFDRYLGPDVHAKQEKMVASLFGWEDSTVAVKHDEELLKASQRAKAKLTSLRAAFNAGLAPGEYIQVKAPFKAPGGGQEWMWVEVTSWKNDEIKGPLRNEPYNIPALHAGQIVEVSEATVFDYLRIHSDGTQEGNETGKIIEKQGHR
jgi:hypothetical protein